MIRADIAGPTPGTPRKCPSSARVNPCTPPARNSNPVRDVECALVLRSVTDYRGQKLVVAKPRGTKTLQLLARPIVRRQQSHAHAENAFNPRAAFVRSYYTGAAAPAPAPVRSASTTRSRRLKRWDPVTAGDEVGPPGEQDLFLGPVDVLCTARRYDLGAAGRTAVAGRRNRRCARPGAGGGASARRHVPQIRMRIRSGLSTVANSTLVPSGNRSCVARSRPRRRNRRSPSSIVGDNTTHCGVADGQDDDAHPLADDRQFFFAQPERLPHAGAKGIAGVLGVQQHQGLDAACRLDLDGVRGCARCPADSRLDQERAPGNARRCRTPRQDCRRH